jgi:cytochrome c553
VVRWTVLLVVVLLVPAVASADAKAGAKKAQLCLVCHKVANTVLAASPMPLLEAQPARYLYLQTKAFKEKRRSEPAMQTNVANLSDRDIRDIADYFAAQKPIRAAHPVDPAKASAGKTTADELRCGSCHVSTYHGKDEVPRLAGQTAGYVIAQLELFVTGKRKHGTAGLLAVTPPEMENLAHFFAQLP